MKSISWQSIASWKLVKTVLTLAVTIFWTACSDSSQNVSPSIGAGAKGKVLDVPTLSCGTSTKTSIQVTVTAGATGAPAGFSLQWMTADALAALSGVWPSSDAANACAASFSGMAFNSNYNLAAWQSVTVTVGDFLFDNGASTNCNGVLTCGTAYVFRVFAHSNGTVTKSTWTPNLTCSTSPCDPVTGVCTYSQGYFKTHNDNVCLVDSTSSRCLKWSSFGVINGLTVGTVSYTNAQLVQILNQTAGGQNKLVALAHQVITAKLNIARGAAHSLADDAALAAADALIGGNVIAPIGTGFISSDGGYTAYFDNFNTGATHCGDESN